jgi:hypothetical protein
MPAAGTRRWSGVHVGSGEPAATDRRVRYRLRAASRRRPRQRPARPPAPARRWRRAGGAKPAPEGLVEVGTQPLVDALRRPGGGQLRVLGGQRGPHRGAGGVGGPPEPVTLCLDLFDHGDDQGADAAHGRVRRESDEPRIVVWSDVAVVSATSLPCPSASDQPGLTDADQRGTPAASGIVDPANSVAVLWPLRRMNAWWPRAASASATSCRSMRVGCRPSRYAWRRAVSRSVSTGSGTSPPGAHRAAAHSSSSVGAGVSAAASASTQAANRSSRALQDRWCGSSSRSPRLVAGHQCQVGRSSTSSPSASTST